MGKRVHAKSSCLRRPQSVETFLFATEVRLCADHILHRVADLCDIDNPSVIDQRLVELFHDLFPNSILTFRSNASVPIVDYTSKINIWLNCGASSSSATARFLNKVFKLGANLSESTLKNFKDKFVIQEFSPNKRGGVNFVSEQVFLKFTLPIFKARLFASSVVNGAFSLVTGQRSFLACYW